jgi:hypothetical protein
MADRNPRRASTPLQCQLAGTMTARPTALDAFRHARRTFLAGDRVDMQALTGLRPSPTRRAGCGLMWVKGLRPATKRCHDVPVHGPLAAVRWPLRAESSGRSIPMTLPGSAAAVLAGHVLFEIEAIDRMYLLSEPVPAAAAARRGDRLVLRRAPGQPVRLLGADGPDDRGVHRGH